MSIQNQLKIDYFTMNFRNSVDPLFIVGLLCENSINESLDIQDFILSSGSFRGYGLSYRYLDKKYITVNFNDSDSEANNGITLNISGLGSDFFTFDCFSKFYKACIKNDLDFKVTRLDLAFDDFEGIIPVQEIINSSRIFMSGDRVISTGKHSSSVKIFTESYKGNVFENLLFGKRTTSEQLFRLYNKLAEQKLPVDGDIKYWERLELELRKTKSDIVSHMLFVQEIPLQEVFYQCLISFFRPVVPGTGAEVNKCDTAPWFKKFTERFLQLDFKLIFCE